MTEGEFLESLITILLGYKIRSIYNVNYHHTGELLPTNVKSLFKFPGDANTMCIRTIVHEHSRMYTTDI